MARGNRWRQREVQREIDIERGRQVEGDEKGASAGCINQLQMRTDRCFHKQHRNAQKMSLISTTAEKRLNNNSSSISNSNSNCSEHLSLISRLKHFNFSLGVLPLFMAGKLRVPNVVINDLRPGQASPSRPHMIRMYRTQCSSNMRHVAATCCMLIRLIVFQFNFD